MIQWSYREYRPQGPIAKYIDCIWMEDFCQNQGKTVHHIVPDNSIELIFSRSPIQRVLSACTSPISLKSQLVGLKTRPQRVSADISPVLGVRFKPRGLYPFLQGKVKDTVDECISPEIAFGSDIQKLEEQVLHAASFEERVKYITSHFGRRLIRYNGQEDFLFDAVLEALETSKGTLSIQELSLKFGVSIKTVERRFRAHVGLTPKKYALSLRVIEALKSARATKTENLSYTAHKYSFFDQAHFIKEVKKYTEMLPKDFAKRDMGVQLPIYR